jgi:hypothetical protein
MYSVYTYLIEELRHGNDVKGWFLTFATSPLMRSMNAEAVLKHRVRTEQTSGQKKSPSKGVLIFYFFQPICKFSGRSDNLLAAGAKGLRIQIRDPGWVKNRIRIRDEHIESYVRELRNQLFGLKYLNYVMRTRDP